MVDDVLIDAKVLLDASRAATWEGAIILASASLLAELERPLASVTDAAAQAVRVTLKAGCAVLVVPGWESGDVPWQSTPTFHIITNVLHVLSTGS